MKTNEEILRTRTIAFDSRPGARVGDFLRLPRLDPRVPQFTRFTHDHGDSIQTGGNANSSYYLTSGGGLSYSGGLDPGVKTSDLILATGFHEGSVWFFDKDISGAGRGVYFNISCRVYDLRPGADTSGLYDLDPGYHLTYWDHPTGCGYHWTISHHAISHTAFRTLPELMAWLEKENLIIGKDPHHPQQILWPAQSA